MTFISVVPTPNPLMTPNTDPIDNPHHHSQVGFYFAYESHFVDMLAVPSVVGAVAQGLLITIEERLANMLVACFAFYVCCWSGYSHECWKDREKNLAFLWGASHQKRFIPDRSDFQGTSSHPVTGRPAAYFPQALKRNAMRQSVGVVLALTLVAVGVVTGIYIFRIAYLSTRMEAGSAQTLASAANAVQIELFKAINGVLAPTLTRHENHRTDAEVRRPRDCRRHCRHCHPTTTVSLTTRTSSSSIFLVSSVISTSSPMRSFPSSLPSTSSTPSRPSSTSPSWPCASPTRAQRRATWASVELPRA